MRKLFIFTAIILFAGVLATGCKKDEKEDPNAVTVNGTTYKITGVTQTNYGDWGGNLNGCINIDLDILAEGVSEPMNLELFCSTGNILLPAGTYSAKYNEGEDNYSPGQFSVYASSDTGTIRVALSNGNYTIDFDMKEGDVTSKGHYSGQIPVVEEEE